LAATSKDGIHFSESEKVIQGSVPEVLKVNGKFLMYYVIPGEDEIRIAESEDGIHFHNSQVVIEKGDEYDKYGAVDPAVIQISENLFRMYYVGWEEDIPGGWGRNSLLTAISTDGILWKKERKILSKEKLSDVAAIRIENGFRIYYSDKDNLYAFDSVDGVSITKDWGKIMERVSVAFVLKTDNEYRLYYTKVPDSPEEGINVYLSTSKDGINFTGEKLILENADAPCVIKLNEKFVIYYHIPSPPPPEASGEEKSVLRSMPQNVPLADRFGFVCFDPLAISDLNLGWVRPHPGPFIWDKIEPERGKYDFSEVDEVVREAQAMGLNILATIWPYAEWDQEKWGNIDRFVEKRDFPELPSSRYKPYDMQAYKEFVKALVERYDGDGFNDMSGLTKPIKYWEILNEPEAQSEDYKCFFQGSGKEYFELVKATYEAVKEADPEAKVVLGGAATLDKESIEWWEEFYSLGGGNYFDIAGVHSYADEKDDFNVDDLKKLLEKYGVSKPIWVTEVGPKGDMSREDDIMFAKAAIRAFANGAEVLFFDYKPVAHVMAYIIGDFDRVEKSSEGVYVFKTKEDKVYVVWKPGKIPIEGSEIYVADIYGNVRVEDASGIDVEDTPIYLFKSGKILQRLKMFMKAQEKEKNY